MMAKNTLFPREVTSNVPFVTITGKDMLHVEQHKGVIAYQPEKIIIRTACGLMHITGKALVFSMYTATEALVTGNISSVSFDEMEGR